jgi:hypothetical protein
MKSLRIKLAAVALAVAALVAAPAAANAQDRYTPTPSGPSTITISASGTATISFSGFQPGEPVTFSLTGEFALSATLATVKTAVETNTVQKAASPTGATSVQVTLPSNAVGQYRLTATGASSGATSAVTINAAAAGSGQVPAATGVDSASLMGVWIGGGVLLLGGLAVTVFAVRRQRQDA